jgi:hypothetical protein
MTDIRGIQRHAPAGGKASGEFGGKKADSGDSEAFSAALKGNKGNKDGKDAQDLGAADSNPTSAGPVFPLGPKHLHELMEKEHAKSEFRMSILRNMLATNKDIERENIDKGF